MKKFYQLFGMAGLLLALTFSAQANAQTIAGVRQQQPQPLISGIVYDSISGMPLNGATVQLVSADDPTILIRHDTSDVWGRFSFERVPDGKYMLGFIHPILDSIGIEPPLRLITVAGQRPVSADLAIPSMAKLNASICGPRSAGILMGIVRDALNDTPVPRATVVGAWLEFTFGHKEMTRRYPRVIATTGENGWYAMCDVPASGSMTVYAGRGADSTDVIELTVPANGFLRRDLFLGRAQANVVTDTAVRAAAIGAIPSRPIRYGQGRIRGTVLSTDEGLPIAGARVSIEGGPQTRANERGEWALNNIPAGTRVLEVRALGYMFHREPVQVTSASLPIHLRLPTVKSVLDTIRITAKRYYQRDHSEYLSRRRSGAGQYLTEEDIARRNPLVTSDVLRQAHWLRIEPDDTGDRYISMGTTPDDQCQPIVYINGLKFEGITADELDHLVHPGEVYAIEVYTAGTVPGEYQRRDGCGVILIWTKR